MPWRSLSRRWSSSIASVLLVALGAGANACVVSVAAGLFLRPLPYFDDQALVSIAIVGANPGPFSGKVPSQVFLGWREDTSLPVQLAAFELGTTVALSREGVRTRVSVAAVSAELLPLLGLSVDRGRPISVSDGGQGAELVAIVTSRFWTSWSDGRKFSGNEIFRSEGRSYRIIGILGDGALFPDLTQPDIIVPLQLAPGSPIVRWLTVIGRLKHGTPGTTVSGLLLAGYLKGAHDYPSADSRLLGEEPAVKIVPLRERLNGHLFPIVALSFAASGVILILTLVSLAGLRLSVATTARRDYEVYGALGATPVQMLGTTAVEGAYVAGLGGVAAIVTMHASITVVRQALLPWAPQAASMAVGTESWLASFAVSLVMSGAAWLPAVWAVHSRRARNHPSPYRYQGGIVTAQVALVTALVCVGSVLALQIRTLAGPSLGFKAAGLTSFRVSPVSGVLTWGQRQHMIETLLVRLRGLPGVESVGAATSLPLESGAFRFAIAIEGVEAPSPADLTTVDLASPGYFAALDSRLVAGREFLDSDGPESPSVAVVNLAFANRFGGSEFVLGRAIALGGSPDSATIRVVGVVGDIRNASPLDAPEPTVWRPLSQARPQMGWHTVAFVIRGSRLQAVTLETVRTLLMESAAAPVPYDWQSMRDRVSASLSREEHRAYVAIGIAGLAVAIASLGIYAFASSLVVSRSTDMAIRLCLGASRARVLRTFAWWFGRPLASGLLTGSALVIVGLLGIDVGPPICAIASAAGPLRRAWCLDPARLLRED